MLREDIIRQLRFFNGLSAELLGLVRAEGEMIGRLPAGEVLFDAGAEVDAVYFALDLRKSAMPVFVRVEIPAPPPAKPLRFDRIFGQDLFGEFEFFVDGMKPGYPTLPAGARRRETRAELLTPADVVRVPLTAIAQLVEQSPVVRQRLLTLAAGRMKSALMNQLRRRHLDLDASLADHLLELSYDYATSYDNYAVFTAKIAQEDIAAELGISRRALTERLKAWSEAGLIRTTPLTLLDIRRITQMTRIGVDAPALLIAKACEQIEEAIDAGDLASAQAMALDLAKFFPSSPDLAFAGALAAARAGRAQDAHTILSAAGLVGLDTVTLKDRVLFGLVKPGVPVTDAVPSGQELADLALEAEEAEETNGVQGASRRHGRLRQHAVYLTGEILSLRARIAKEAALVSGDRDQAVAAAQLYTRAHDLVGRSSDFPAVNAASLYLSAGDRARAQDLAGSILNNVRGDDYWAQVSRAEAQLVLGAPDRALDAAKQAMTAPHSDGMVASTRKQLRRFRDAYGAGVDEVLAVLTVRRPFVYTGTMIRDGQFEVDSETVEAYVAEKAEAFLSEHNAGAAYGPLARGSDLIIAKAVLDAGLELHAVLPFDIESFADVSVSGGDKFGAIWRQRFDAVIGRCTSVTVVQPGKPLARDLDISFRHGFRCAAAYAIERASDLETRPLLLAVTAKGPAGELAGTSADMEDWRQTGGDLVQIDLPYRKLAPSGAPHLKHGFRPVVFYFPDPRDALSARERMEQAVRDGGIDAVGVLDRRIKDGRVGAATVCADFDAALALAFALNDLPGNARDGRVICDYGPVLGRSGEPDPELVARMAGAGDFAGFPPEKVLAATSFAQEIQFAAQGDFTAIRVGQRSYRSTERGRIRIVPATGVYALARRSEASRLAKALSVAV